MQNVRSIADFVEDCLFTDITIEWKAWRYVYARLHHDCKAAASEANPFAGIDFSQPTPNSDDDNPFDGIDFQALGTADPDDLFVSLFT